MKKLTPKQDRFVTEYLATGNASEAYRRAYDVSRMLDTTIGRNAHALIKDAKIAAEITERREATVNAAVMDRAGVVQLITEIATASAADLMRLEVRNCRHCWGAGHKFQWVSPEEYAFTCAKVSDLNARAQQDWAEAIERGTRLPQPKDRPLPDDDGGYGWVKNAHPNPACPECHGDGIETPRFKDTRLLKGPARRLFAGIERTKDGFKMHTRDQKHALQLLAQITGAVKTDGPTVNMQVNNAPGGTVQTAVVMPADPLAAATAYAELMKGTT